MTGEFSVEEIKTELSRLTVNRLVHFTPSRNLPHIFAAGEIKTTAALEAPSTSATFARTDTERFDGHRDKICCSLQYPNTWYLKRAQDKAPAMNFPDWSLLFIDPEVAARYGTLFCPRNAAAGRGASLVSGIMGLRACYAPVVEGAGGTWTRGYGHVPAAPTDLQAEVLVPGSIPLSKITAVALPTAQHVRQERGRLRQLGYDPTRVAWRVASGLFDTGSVGGAARRGRPLVETEWTEDLEGP